MASDSRDVYVSDLVRFIAAFAADLPPEPRRSLMRRFLPSDWIREPDGRVRLLNSTLDDLGSLNFDGPLLEGFPTVSAPGLHGKDGRFFNSHQAGAGVGDVEDGLDVPWKASWLLHAYLLKLRDAGVLL